MSLMLVAAMQAAVVVPVPPATATATAAAPVVAAVPVLLRDTPVELMATSEVDTDDAVAGTVFKLRVNRAVEQGGRVVVPVGTAAFGEVVTASDAGGLGKSGRMTARLLHLRVDGVEVPLDGQVSARGVGAGSPAVAVLFTGLMGLFHRGNNAKIKAGEIINGYVAADTPLAPAMVATAP